MNDQVQDLMVEGGEFVAEQAPLLAQEIVRWGIWWHALEVVLWIGIISACIWGARTLWSRREEAETPLYEIGTVLCWILALIFLPCTGSALASMLKAALAPRLYIIEQIAGLI